MFEIVNNLTLLIKTDNYTQHIMHGSEKFSKKPMCSGTRCSRKNELIHAHPVDMEKNHVRKVATIVHSFIIRNRVQLGSFRHVNFVFTNTVLYF